MKELYELCSQPVHAGALNPLWKKQTLHGFAKPPAARCQLGSSNELSGDPSLLTLAPGVGAQISSTVSIVIW